MGDREQRRRTRDFELFIIEIFILLVTQKKSLKQLFE
jgi:hypothetical protein